MGYENKIKNFKPKRNSKYHQGYIDPKSLNKYYSSLSNEPIIYRSELELNFIQFCENNSKIIKWASEPFGIKYTYELDKKEHTYYPDYIIENDNGDKTLVEIKPSNQTIKPKINDSKWLKESWIKNISKWKAAKEYAASHNMNFIIITEKFFKYK